MRPENVKELKRVESASSKETRKAKYCRTASADVLHCSSAAAGEVGAAEAETQSQPHHATRPYGE